MAINKSVDDVSPMSVATGRGTETSTRMARRLAAHPARTPPMLMSAVKSIPEPTEHLPPRTPARGGI